MNIEELNKKIDIPDFEEAVTEDSWLYTLESPEVMQVNVGRICNLACKHCHVSAGPDRREVISRDILEKCLEAFKKYKFKIMDITGGAPEMVADFEWFVRESSKIAQKVIVRTNLVILLSEKYKHLPEFYKENSVNVVCSLPFYTKKNTDRQRGDGVFEKSIKVLKILNSLGYGKDLELDLVYNPAGAFLPPSQSEMENLYREKLYTDFGIVFNNLYAITNNPIGRFGDFLDNTDNLKSYMETLYGSFNISTVENMMCRNQISVSWDGAIYDCDFNQAVDICAEDNITIDDICENGPLVRKIKTGKHCYACTAGAGSSCGGATS